MALRHASFFSGIGGFDLGFERAGIELVSHSEVKPYACAILASRWPDVPNLGDLTALDPAGVPDADVWSGGFPCSDLSVMGRRAGLRAGRRSSLGLVFLDLVERRRPRWLVLENVPGLLSSHAGRDLAHLLDRLAGLGYGWAYRLLDAGDFGLAQSRRRVIVVATARADDAASVLLAPIDRGRPAPAEPGPRARASGRAPGGAPDRVFVGTFSKRLEQQLPSRADGRTYALTPGGSQYVLRGSAPDADGVRASAGLPAGLDGPDAGGPGGLRPERLDGPRWHVLGRAVPVPIAEWVGRGIVDVDAHA